jgi:hypothetical protein
VPAAKSITRPGDCPMAHSAASAGGAGR